MNKKLQLNNTDRLIRHWFGLLPEERAARQRRENEIAARLLTGRILQKITGRN